MVPDEGVNFRSTAPMHISLFVLSIGYVMVSHCQQAQYVHQFVHQSEIFGQWNECIYAYRYQYRVSDIRVSTEYRDR